VNISSGLSTFKLEGDAAMMGFNGVWQQGGLFIWKLLGNGKLRAIAAKTKPAIA
jgi:hypothetical protein